MSNNNNTNTLDDYIDDDDDLSRRPNGKMIAEAQAEADIADWVYQESRLVIRNAGGMISTVDAVKTVLENPSIKEKLLLHMAKHGDALDKEFVARFRASPTKTIAWLDAECAELESPD
jgi:hypothetical protein